jgi:hypothetical protein
LLAQSSLVPEVATGSGTPTFTRATAARVLDWEGLLKPVLSGEARFTGARRVQNLVYRSNDFTQLNGGIEIHSTATATTVSFSEASAYRFPLVSGLVSGRTYVARVTLSSSDGKTGVGLGLDGSRVTVLLTSTPTIYTISLVATSTTMYFGLDNRVGQGGDNGTTGSVTAVDWQFEDIIGQSNTNPSEFVSVGVLSAPYHGAGVDGVKYFSTLNGNQVV